MFGDAIFEYADCKRCGNPFEKRSWNSEYCDACKKPRHNERMLQRYHEKNGGKPRGRKHHDWTSYHRFKFYLEKTAPFAFCPICGEHMSVCQCSASDPDLRQWQALEPETWQPWK